MLNTVAGAYQSVESPIHSLDTRVKLAFVAVMSLSIFFLDSYIGLGLFLLITLVILVASKLNWKSSIRALKPLSIILLIMFLANALSIHADLVLIGNFGLSSEGALRGVFYVLRIVMLVLMSLVLTSTSTVQELSQALNWYLSGLRRFNAPVDDIITTISIAIRFIPLTFAEFNRVVYAQKSRGLDFDSGSIFTKIKAYLPVFIPMFVGLFKRSYDLADAMDSRCYRGEGRTILHAEEPLTKAQGILAILALLAVLVISLLF